MAYSTFMDNLKKVIGDNLTKLRKSKNLTQAELALKFNYSDKAISKWEKGDTLPDIEVLSSLCDFYGVTLDYLTHSTNQDKYIKEEDPTIKTNRIITLALIFVVIWMIPVIIFTYTYLVGKSGYWVSFSWAIPVSAAVLGLYNRRTFRSKVFNIACLSSFDWGTITSIYLTVLVTSQANVWPLFLIGIPIQMIIVLMSSFKKKV